MASSQVEMVSSSPFGCVLRDHNRKGRCRESNVRAVQAVFEKNFKELVRGHFHGCISLSSEDNNSQNQISRVASWVDNGQQQQQQQQQQGNGNRHNLPLLKKNLNNTKNDEPLAITPRQSRVLDRWVTSQAQDVTASIIDKHVNEVDPLLVPSNSNPAPPPTSMASSSNMKNAHNCSTQSGNASVMHNPGASSLVQMWEARLNRSNSMNSNQNQSQSMGCTSNRTSFGLSSNENNATAPEEPGDSFDENDNGTNNEDSLMDWESQSDRTVPDEPPPSLCSRSTCDAAGERERVRVADIIKRLRNGSEDANDHEHGNHGTDSPPRERKHFSTSDQTEQRSFSQIVHSPRLRGRQAFNDLLTQIERDKNRELGSLAERQAVSKFSQRGRLQSMLRLRCLQRSLKIQDKCRPQSAGAQVNRLQQGSTIMHLREKFSSGAERPMTTQNDPTTPRCLPKESSNDSIQLDKSSTSKQQRGDTHDHEKVSSAGQQTTTTTTTTTTATLPGNRLTTMNTNEDLHEQTKPPTDHAIQEKTSLEARGTESLESAEATTSLEGQSESENMAKKQGSNTQQHLFLHSPQIAGTIVSPLNVHTQNEIAQQQDKPQHHLCLDVQETRETTTSCNSCTDQNDQEQDMGDQQPLYPDFQETVETVTSYNDLDENNLTEELEDHYQHYFSRTNYDWISDISRPRSYWEGLRQAWYQEVLNTTSKDEDIHQLLERRTVSSFLASDDFRERMDRLMTSRVQMQADRAESQQDEEDEDDRMVQVMSYLQRHLDPAGVEREEQEERDGVVLEGESGDGQKEEEVYDEGEDEDEDEDEYEEMSLISHQYGEANDYFNQSTSSTQMPSPSVMRSWTYRDSDRTPSTCSPPPGPSRAQYYHHDARQYSSSAINRPSLEMELICNLRDHIEQLHHEMAELRKSIVSCMDVQMKFQQSCNRQLHSVGGKRKNSAKRASWKRNCCICYEMQVDCLLYRCGHMCTCLKCAQELQWSGGNCPICRAPILDVVRATLPPN